MTRTTSPSPITFAAVAATSLALAVGVTACVRTVSGPLPQAGQSQALSPASGGYGDGGAGYGDDGAREYGFGGFTYGGPGYGGYGYGGGGYGGYGYGGYGYGGGSYGGGSYGGVGYGGHPPIADIYACRVDADCTVYFRTQACFPADPVAVATARLDDARRLLPVRFEACGMGGPDYERRRQANEGRYGARCEQQRCAVTDRGPRRTPF